MKSKYQEFLNTLDIISEENFNEIIDSLPEFEICEVDFNVYNSDAEDDIAEVIINHILENWEYCFADCVSFCERRFRLYDVYSIHDLEEIAKIFNGWTISNYDELESELKRIGKEFEELTEFDKLLSEVKSKATIKQLKEFINKL